MTLREYMLNEDILSISHRKFHQHMININEVFDKDIELGKPKWKDGIFSVKFKVKDVTYTFSAMEHAPNEFAVLFYSQGIDPFELKSNRTYSGDVFAGVKKSLHLLINSRKVDVFWFNTGEEPLKRLYDKMVKRLIKEFKDFELEESKSTKDGIKFWIFTRGDKSL